MIAKMIEIEVSCEYIKNVCFDYIAKFPLQRLKTMRSLHGNDPKRPFHELDYNVICLDLLAVMFVYKEIALTTKS